MCRELEEISLCLPEPREGILALDEARQKFAAVQPEAAELVQLLYFAGLPFADAARTLGISANADATLANIYLQEHVGEEF